ncbi:MAG: hypothetical protein JEZ11_17180, partial [Desulfobacterales bacterium]|nr:hypothetical protein [Desulfobacterales bacterium]
MKTKSIVQTVLFILLLTFGITAEVGAAKTVSLHSTDLDQVLSAGDTFELLVRVDDATDVAGAALTVGYDNEVFQVEEVNETEGEADLGYFEAQSATFVQVTDTRTEPGDPASAVPSVGNQDATGLVKLSGAFVNTDPVAGGGGAYTDEQTLFRVHFKVRDGAVHGPYNFTLIQTQLFNPDAGWYTDANASGTYDAGGTEDAPVPVPVLTAANAMGTDEWDTAELTDDFYAIPDVTLTTPLQLTVDDTYSISGAVTYIGIQNGDVYVGAFTSADRDPANLAAVVKIDDPGFWNPATGQPQVFAYTLTGLPDGTYYVAAFRDTDGESDLAGVPPVIDMDSGEASGWFNGGEVPLPVVVSGTDVPIASFWIVDDTDGDGIWDVLEFANFGTLDRDGSGDNDNDGLTDSDELNIYGTNPNNPDSDGDGLSDGDEVNTYGTNPALADSDGDGVDDGMEVALGTSPSDGGDTAVVNRTLYDDFESGFIDPARWNSVEGVRRVNDGVLVSKARGPGNIWTRNRARLVNPQSVAHLKADVTLTEIVRESTDVPVFARVEGVLFNAVDAAPTNHTGNVWVGVAIGKLPGDDTIQAWWDVTQSDDAQWNTETPLGGGTIDTGATVLAMDTVYQLEMGYDETVNTLHFAIYDASGTTLLGSASFDTAGGLPVPMGPAFGANRSLTTGVHFTNTQPGSGSVTAAFDNVMTDDAYTAGGTGLGLYDDFATAPLDAGRWLTYYGELEVEREIVDRSGDTKVRQAVFSAGSQETSSLAVTQQSPWIEAEVTVGSDSAIQVDTFGRARIDGYFYNDTFGPGSPNGGYQGVQGDVWAQVKIDRQPDGSLSAGYYAERAQDPDGNTYLWFFDGNFAMPIVEDRPYRLTLGVTGTHLVFGCEDTVTNQKQTVLYDIATGVYPPVQPYKNLTTRVYEGPTGGYMAVDFDDVYLGGPDADGDTVPDFWDAFPNDDTEWADADTDGTGDNADTDDDNDGLLDADEGPAGTNPYNPDSDGDGLTDGDEVHTYGTVPTDPDTDNDGLSDGYEASFWSGNGNLTTDFDLGGEANNLLDPDADNDGELDGVEVALGGDPGNDQSQPNFTDCPFDDFESQTIDPARWTHNGVGTADVVGGQARLSVSTDGSDTFTNRLNLADTAKDYLEAVVTLSADSTIPSGTRGRVRIAGYLYNDTYGPGSPNGDVYNGGVGEVFAHVKIDQFSDGTFSAGVYAYRQMVPVWSSDDDSQVLLSRGFSLENFSQPLQTGRAYKLGMGFTGTHLIFVLEDLAAGEAEVIVYPVTTDHYTAANPGLGLHNRIYGGAGSAAMIADWDDVIAAPCTRVDVSGTVAYSGEQTGDIRVGAFVNPDELTGDPVASAIISAPGAYTLSVPAYGTYYVGAYRDSDASTTPDPGEAFGRYGTATETTSVIVAETAVTGIDFALEDPDTDGDGVPDFQDAFPANNSEWADADGDGIGDNADPDDDNDTMSDAWEAEHGVADPDGDADGDLVTNAEEFYAATDPNDPSSVPVLYDDFEAPKIDAGKWSVLEQVQEVVAGVLVSKARGVDQIGETLVPFSDPAAVQSIRTDMRVVETAIAGFTGDATVKAGILGYFLKADATGADPIGDVQVQFGLLEDAEGFRPGWLVKRTDDLENNKSLIAQGWFTNAGPPVFSKGSFYTLELIYDGDKTFTFNLYDPAVPGTPMATDSYTVPCTTVNAVSTPFKGIGTAADIDNGDAGDGYIHAEFDNVYINGGATVYDDFSTEPLDPSKWAVNMPGAYLEIAREIIDHGDNSALRLKAHSAGVNATTWMPVGRASNYIAADLAVHGQSDQGRAELGGFFYNTTYGPGSPDGDHNGHVGDVWARAYIDDTDGQLTAGYYAIVFLDAAAIQYMPIMGGSFNMPILPDQQYRFSLAFTGSQLVFTCTDLSNGQKEVAMREVPVSYPSFGSTMALDSSVATPGLPGAVMDAEFDNVALAPFDTDGDGLFDHEEIPLGTNPYDRDSDNDGLTDGDEAALWGADWHVDYDTDGLNNLLDSDADGDGELDGFEVAMGSDPGDPASLPALDDCRYDDFESGAIDSGRWNANLSSGGATAQVLDAGGDFKLHLAAMDDGEGIEAGTTRNTNSQLITVPGKDVVEATVHVTDLSFDAVDPSGQARGRIRVQGDFYNDTYDGSGGYNGSEGQVFAMVAIDYYSDGSMNAKAFAERLDNADGSASHEIFTQPFEMGIDTARTYTLAAGRTATHLVFHLEDDLGNEELILYAIETPIYESAFPGKALLTRFQASPGYGGTIAADWDDVYAGPCTRVDISGTVAYSGDQTGDILVGAFDNPDFIDDPVNVIAITAPGAYALPVPVNGTYYVTAVRDSNNSLEPDPGEAEGYYGDGDGPFAVVVAAETVVSGIDFILADPDSDGDGLYDYEETGTYSTNPDDPDTDNDGLKDGAEVTSHGTNPNAADTDGDETPDGIEVALGSDPNDYDDVPADDACLYDDFSAGSRNENLWNLSLNPATPPATTEIVFNPDSVTMTADNTGTNGQEVTAGLVFAQDKDFFQAAVTVKNGSDVDYDPSWVARGRARIDGYFYNVANDPSEETKRLNNVWGQVYLEMRKDEGGSLFLRAKYSLERVTDENHTAAGEQLFGGQFDMPVSFESQYVMGIGFTGTHMVFSIRNEAGDEEFAVYEVTGTTFAPYNDYKRLTTRINGNASGPAAPYEGKIIAEWDDAFVAPCGPIGPTVYEDAEDGTTAGWVVYDNDPAG